MESQEAVEFIKGIEASLGARIGWRTFAPWYADNSGIIREYGVFLCLTDDGRLYFEDFERLPQILGYTLKPRNPVKYEKYSKAIEIKEIKAISRVKKKQAADTCSAASRIPLTEAGSLAKALSPIVTQIELNSKECYYFELISHREFMAALTKARGDVNGSI